jgi:hypothetical protein
LTLEFNIAKTKLINAAFTASDFGLSEFLATSVIHDREVVMHTSSLDDALLEKWRKKREELLLVNSILPKD